MTPFLEVLSWSRDLMMFLRTDQADEIVKKTEQLGKSLNTQRAAEDAKGGFLQLPKLAAALKKFSDDFTTIRTGLLLVGEKSSARQLRKVIEQTKCEVEQHIPTLVPVLGQIQAMVEPLDTDGDRLSSQKGQRALLELARLYQKMGRYSEAISVLREGWISLNAPPGADQPGDQLDKNAREQQEKSWQNTTQAKSVSELRNDIQHAGYKKQSHKRGWFEKQLTTLLNEWQKAIDSM